MALNSTPLSTIMLLLLLAGCQTSPDSLRSTGDLGVIVERATGSLALVDTSHQRQLDRVEGLGDLSHASVKFSRDARYAFVFGRDGGLSKVDLLTGDITTRIMQSGNSIGGAISQDGQLIAVANYEPGGVKLFDSDNLALVADIPAIWVDAGGREQRSKVVGLVDAPGNRFVYSLFDAGEIYIVNMNGETPELTRFIDVGANPYDALIDASGRYYIAGLFGEDGLALLDLWHIDAGVQRILPNYGRGEERLPVYKMPHLEGWAMAGNEAWLPAVGRHEVLIADKDDWSLTGRIPVQGQPIFVMSRPDQRQIWVSFAHPDNDVVQVIDTETRTIVATLSPGKAILHMEFTPRGEHVWISARDSNRVTVYDTHTLQEVARLESESPSGIFFTDRAHRIGL
ncbi:cytochrome D1 domain-containing protein [Halovibrio sp. HP20-50]|uniref:cytochrome D1 domain-containing protein n=1 Tax=Halovibrio sp. HP20-59 TaxID=3080275 RepID=UPI00294ABB8F|nr:cytochrome D1 domain-containing protein [Halovibrio sp. HP20-59]MEA2118527.1 cytochrome D1 domain-containing protein [Halovibrio sp. HP20-59]